MVQDTGRCFQKIYEAMGALCGEASLSGRLELVLQNIGTLLVDEVPQPMRSDFIAIREAILAAREHPISNEDRGRIADDFITLYTKAARLQGVLQEVVGNFSTV